LTVLGQILARVLFRQLSGDKQKRRIVVDIQVKLHFPDFPIGGPLVARQLLPSCGPQVIEYLFFIWQRDFGLVVQVFNDERFTFSSS